MSPLKGFLVSIALAGAGFALPALAEPQIETGAAHGGAVRRSEPAKRAGR